VDRLRAGAYLSCPRCGRLARSCAGIVSCRPCRRWAGWRHCPGNRANRGFIDIVCDFLVYAAIPLAFAIADPPANALAAAALLASFIASGVTFLAFATLAAKRGLTTAAQGPKSIYYLAGLAEGAETIIVFAAMMLWPAWFPALAFGFAGLCAVSAAARIVAAVHTLR
jgi:phosphatidylglycerophosphate synthase